MKDPKKVSEGRRSRARGKTFELRVRKDLEEKCWIVDKWSNNVCLEQFSGQTIHATDGKCLEGFTPSKHDENEAMRDYKTYGKLIKAKNNFRGKGIPMALGSGFPDFICMRRETNPPRNSKEFKKIPEHHNVELTQSYEVIGVESKMEGKLDKLEKEKCSWLLQNKIFSKILIASKEKIKNRIVVKYTDFEEKYGTK